MKRPEPPSDGPEPSANPADTGPAALPPGIEAAVVVVDGALRLLAVDAGWTRLLGHSGEQSLGRSLGEFLHPGEACPALVEPEAAPRALRWVHSSGALRWLELRAGASGEPDRWTLLLTDCTARVRADETREAGHRTLASLVEQFPGMVYRCRNNASWTMEFVSQGALELTGYPPEALLNNHRVAYADLIHPDDRQQVWDEVQRALQAFRPFEVVNRIRAADGSEKWVADRGRGNFTESGELLGVVGYIHDVTAERHAELRRQHAWLHDDSGLPTPALFRDRLSRALARARRQPLFGVALLHLQIERFARLRDLLGPAGLAHLSREIGRRFALRLGPVDSVCPWNSGGFLVLVECLDGERGATTAARELMEALAHAFEFGEREVLLSASIGIALSSTGYERDEDILQDAALAMARARDSGGGRWELFDRHARARAAERRLLVSELETALAESQFTLLAEPVALVADDSLFALELKLAWRHPRRGLLDAQCFLEPVDELPLARGIRNWFLGALGEHPALRAELPRIHVDIPAASMLERGFVSRLLDQLRGAGRGNLNVNLVVTPKRLGAEGLYDPKLAQLAAQPGLGIVLDEVDRQPLPFGLLRQLPLAGLRVAELCHADDGQQNRIDAGIVALAHTLGVPVIARGVETQAQRAALSRLNCDCYQGALRPWRERSRLPRESPDGEEARPGGPRLLH